MNKIVNIFTNDFPFWEKFEFFRKVVYIFLLFNTLTLLPIAGEIWGYHGIIAPKGFEWSGTYPFINLLSHPYNADWTWIYKFFIGGQILFLILGLLRIFPIISSMAVYFFTVNLFLRGSLMFTGGEVLINFLLFYMMFIHRAEKDHRSYFFRNLLANTFFRIMLIQVCVLYFYSCLYKLFDENWLSGEAIMYISRIGHFSSSSFRWLFEDNVGLAMFFTYLTLAYQGLFPLLVWFKKIKIPFLLVGVAFHLAIAIFMGIFTFALVMIISYILFIDDKHIHWLKNIFRRNRSKSVS